VVENQAVTRHFEREPHPHEHLVAFTLREIHPAHGKRTLAVGLVTAALRRAHDRYAVIAAGQRMPEPVDERGGTADVGREDVGDEQYVGHADQPLATAARRLRAEEGMTRASRMWRYHDRNISSGQRLWRQSRRRPTCSAHCRRTSGASRLG